MFKNAKLVISSRLRGNNLSFEFSWLSLFLGGMVIVWVLLTMFRVLGNASTNYQVYQAELASLTRLQKENEELEKQLDYYRSLDFAQIYIRDNLRRGNAGERFYEIILPDRVWGLDKFYLNINNVSNDNLWGLIL